MKLELLLNYRYCCKCRIILQLAGNIQLQEYDNRNYKIPNILEKTLIKDIDSMKLVEE